MPLRPSFISPSSYQFGVLHVPVQAMPPNINERTGTPFNSIEIPTDIVFQLLLLGVRYKLSYRKVAEYFLIQGFEFTYDAVRDWEERLLPHLTDQIREKRKAKVGKSWFVDETYVKVLGSWCYLYQDGNLVDVRLSAHRDMEETKAFFAQAVGLYDDTPETVATDGLVSYPRAIKEELGNEVRPCTANPVEQSHRLVKYRYYPTLGFGDIESANRFCRAVDEVANFLRPRSQMAEFVCLSDRRAQFVQKVKELEALLQPA